MLISASKSQNGEYSWYFKPAGHEQPVCFGGDGLPGEYGALYLGAPDEKVVYLTFDAGYDNGNVARTVEILHENEVTGAFFILPEMARSHADVLLKMAEYGDLICNHSTTHRNMAKIADYETFAQELRGCEEALEKYTGLKMAEYFRPPEGAFSKKTLEFCRRAGYAPVFWSFAYADWDNSAQKDAEWAYNKILDNLHNGMVMLLHPTSATNAAILDRVIKAIKSQGYRFGTLDELAFYAKTGFSFASAQSGNALSRNPGRADCVALTFDDGPHPEYTPQILDILKKYGVKATFFVIGKNAEAHPELVERIIAEGHEIGNHTYSHPYLKNCGAEGYVKDAERLQNFLTERFGVTPAFFRPPGGGYREDVARGIEQLGLKYVLWAWRTDARDWASPTAASVAKTVLSTVEGGDVVLLHDYVAGKSPTPEALERIIPELIARGYELVTLSGLFCG